MFYWLLMLFLFFSFFSPRGLRAPSADRRETLPRDRKCAHFYNQCRKIRGPSPPKKYEAKTCKIRRDFGQLQTSIANICGTDADIQNRKYVWSTAIPPAFGENKPWWTVKFKRVGKNGPTSCSRLAPPKVVLNVRCFISFLLISEH